MRLKNLFFITLLFLYVCQEVYGGYFKTVQVNSKEKSFKIINQDQISSVLVAVTINNHGHSLSTFLRTLETLKCYKLKTKKCNLWIIFDSCTDKSYDIFTHWLTHSRTIFDKIIMINTQNDDVTKQKHPDLDPKYFSKNLKLRAIKYASDNKFNYIFFLNADTILTEPETIGILMKRNKNIIAPMLTSFKSESDSLKIYSIFYPDQKFIYNRDILGTFRVSLVQSCFLLRLNENNFLKLQGLSEINKLNGPKFLIFDNIDMYVNNVKKFGYIPEENSAESFIHLRMEHLLYGPSGAYNEPLQKTKFIDEISIKKRRTKLGFSLIFIINLERRIDRKKRIESALNDLNLSYKTIKAIDAQKINKEYLKKLNLTVMPDYKDPFTKRPINYGEIACFLSHYFIWKEMVDKNMEKIVILEDDARFDKNFKSVLVKLMNQMKEKEIGWDLIYLGRKIMKNNEETWNNKISPINNHGIVNPSFSYWTVGYVLSLNGAKKLLNAQPLKNILPVDEFLPLMFGKQPNAEWVSHFPQRNLNAFAIHPSIISPTHYTSQEGHISDTEYTNVLNLSELQNEGAKNDNHNIYMHEEL